LENLKESLIDRLLRILKEKGFWLEYSFKFGGKYGIVRRHKDSVDIKKCMEQNKGDTKNGYNIDETRLEDN
jgi:hypothetical protein